MDNTNIHLQEDADKLLFAEDLVGFVMTHLYNVPYLGTRATPYRDLIFVAFNDAVRVAVVEIANRIIWDHYFPYEVINSTFTPDKDLYLTVIDDLKKLLSTEEFDPVNLLYYCVTVSMSAAIMRRNDLKNAGNIAVSAIYDFIKEMDMMTTGWGILTDTCSTLKTIREDRISFQAERDLERRRRLEEFRSRHPELRNTYHTEDSVLDLNIADIFAEMYDENEDTHSEKSESLSTSTCEELSHCNASSEVPVKDQGESANEIPLTYNVDDLFLSKKVRCENRQIPSLSTTSLSFHTVDVIEEKKCSLQAVEANSEAETNLVDKKALKGKENSAKQETSPVIKDIFTCFNKLDSSIQNSSTKAAREVNLESPNYLSTVFKGLSSDVLLKDESESTNKLSLTCSMDDLFLTEKFQGGNSKPALSLTRGSSETVDAVHELNSYFHGIDLNSKAEMHLIDKRDFTRKANPEEVDTPFDFKDSEYIPFFGECNNLIEDSLTKAKSENNLELPRLFKSLAPGVLEKDKNESTNEIPLTYSMDNAFLIKKVRCENRPVSSLCKKDKSFQTFDATEEFNFGFHAIEAKNAAEMNSTDNRDRTGNANSAKLETSPRLKEDTVGISFFKEYDNLIKDVSETAKFEDNSESLRLPEKFSSDDKIDLPLTCSKKDIYLNKKVQCRDNQISLSKAGKYFQIVDSIEQSKFSLPAMEANSADEMLLSDTEVLKEGSNSKKIETSAVSKEGAVYIKFFSECDNLKKDISTFANYENTESLELSKRLSSSSESALQEDEVANEEKKL